MTRQSDALRDLLGRHVAGRVIDLATTTHEILVETTPVDTGAARAGWGVRPGAAGSLIVGNDEEHVQYLTRGSSKQAPAHFVEDAIEQAIVAVRAQRGRRGKLAGTVGVVAPGLSIGGKR